jgi:hypothetical protein
MLYGIGGVLCLIYQVHVDSGPPDSGGVHITNLVVPTLQGAPLPQLSAGLAVSAFRTPRIGP